MRALEHEIGHPLVIRSHQGVRLTQAGKVLLARTDEIAAVLSLAENEQAEFDALERGTVRLAVFGSGAATLIPSVIQTLRKDHPALGIRLTEAEPEEAFDLLAGDDVDIAVVFRYPPEPEQLPAGITARTLVEELIRLVTARSHQLPDTVTMADLAEESWIAGCPSCRTHLVNLCQAAGFMPHIQHSTDDYVIVQNLAATDVGITLLPDAALRAFRHPGIRIVDSPAWGVRRIGAATHQAATRVPAIAATLRALRQAARSSSPVPTKVSQPEPAHIV